jgi:hypothetical protein
MKNIDLEKVLAFCFGIFISIGTFCFTTYIIKSWYISMVH